MLLVGEMEKQEQWIAHGKIIARPTHASGSRLSDKTLLFQQELVKVETTPAGTSCKWVMFGANWTSLYVLRELLSTYVAPYTFEFFNTGWFNETFQSVTDARLRVDQLISKSDVRFSTRTYTRSFSTSDHAMTPRLKSMWNSGGLDESSSVHCTINTELEQTVVDYIGPNSALAKVWGVSPVSYPTLSGHSYDRVVSKSYYEVIRTGRPHFDHVLAAMVRPDGIVQWLGYQRLVFPKSGTKNGLPQVSVACEFADVKIPLL